MDEIKAAVVVTTIQPPTQAMRALAEGCEAKGWPLIVIGDQKGPLSYELEAAAYYNLLQQEALGFKLAKTCARNSYARKNLGYLAAISMRVDVIIETDDDNAPKKSFFDRPSRKKAALTYRDLGWVNVYQHFTRETIWPRGFPLRYVLREHDLDVEAGAAPVTAPIQQGLADGNPDVDAIFRMTRRLPLFFDERLPVALTASQYCPLNSQNTTFFREAFPLLYLPSSCPFRLTDIWRGFVALRICHAMGWPTIFSGATVTQDRNPHDLMRDFNDEIDGYRYNETIVETLEQLPLSSRVDEIADHLVLCYEALVEKGYFAATELDLVADWLEDLREIG